MVADNSVLQLGEDFPLRVVERQCWRGERDRERGGKASGCLTFALSSLSCWLRLWLSTDPPLQGPYRASL